MKRTIHAGLLALLSGVMVCPVVADPSVGWRNEGTGVFPNAKPPETWAKDKNVLWKVALPGLSYAAPIVVGDNLFVVSDPSDLLCVRRKDGVVLWKKSLADVKAPAGGGGRGGFGGPGGPGGRRPGGRPGGGGGGGGMGGYGRSAGNSAASPVSDGKYVAMVLGNGVVAVHDLEGKRLWAKFIESARIGNGHSASPLLIGGKLIVHLKDVVALDVATGKESWRTELSATHANPVAARLGKEDVVVSPAGAVVRASDGKILAKGEFRSSDNSPVVSGDTICLSARGAFKMEQNKDGEVKVTALWTNGRAPEEGERGGRGGRGGMGGMGGERKYPSPVVHDGLLYTVASSGMLDVVDVKTGKSVYKQRLPVGQVYSSIALAGGQFYVLDTQGKAVVFKPGRKYERVAVNQLEPTPCCPVFADDHLYVRGQKTLFCISGKASEKAKQ